MEHFRHGFDTDEIEEVRSKQEQPDAPYKVGYTPAHFSVAFRKKYGFAPKEMRS